MIVLELANCVFPVKLYQHYSVLALNAYNKDTSRLPASYSIK